jgi:hypothetical protein
MWVVGCIASYYLIKEYCLLSFPNLHHFTHFYPYLTINKPGGLTAVRFMKVFFACFLLFFCVFLANAQTIKGRVYRGGGDTVVANAVIYYGGSTVGTSADEHGNFELAAKPQQIPIVVSCVGYYSATVNYQPGKLLVVRLQPKTELLNTVTVRAKGRTNSLDRKAKEHLFIQEFLGISDDAKSCIIINMDDINLFYNDNTGTLTAGSENPIIIQNKKLGYTINYYLDSFSRTLNRTHYAGNAFFKEDTASTSTKQAAIINNREQAYIGSRMHFVRALWSNTLDTAGFRITDKKRLPIPASRIVITDPEQQKYIHLENRISVYHTKDPGNENIISSTKPYLFIDKNGFYDQGLLWTGPMSDQRVGEQLPFEYRSKNDVNENLLIANVNSGTITTAKAADPPISLPININKASAGTSVPAFFEKVYLHTDRDVYVPHEDIWYKAYVVNAQNNQVVDYSKNLYVELISPSAKIVSRKMLRLEKGLANGDFKLADTLTSGYYRLRAYTNWMRNFGDNFIFEKTIRVADDGSNTPAVEKIIVGKKQTVKARLLPKVNLDTLPIVRFFPESGSMISGVSAIIAVKAEDENGRGIAAKGNILDNSGETVTIFVCDSLGFGAFTILPEVTQHYLAVVTIRRKDRKFLLPAVASLGFNMRVQDKQSQLTIAISCTDSTFNKSKGPQIYLEAKHGGKTYVRQLLLLTNKNLLVRIPDDLLTEGINAITLSDAKNQPQCERLVYIHHPFSTQLSINTDKIAYRPKEKATVHIKLNKPGIAHLSLAAVDALTVPVQSENIVSYLELQSEVRGHIEQAAKYFDTTNVNRFKQLDLLLLTQGWRDFVWKHIADTTLKFDREIEQGITVTGRVRRQITDKPMAGMHIALHAPKAEGDKFFEATTDQAGKFAIYGPVFYGYQYLNLSSRNFEGKNKGKSNSGGWIKVDSLYEDMLPVNAVNNFVTDTLPSAEEMMMKLKIPQKQQLKEVKIVANPTKFAPEIHPITLADQKDYGNVLQYLLNNIPGSHVELNGSEAKRQLKDVNSLNIGVSSTYSDGSKIDRNVARGQDPLDLPVTGVISVVITKFVTIYGFVTYRVRLVLRPGAFAMKDYFDNTTADMVGYYKARIFYKPKFSEIDDKPDPRINTIHWEPNVVTDKNGEATISYYNTDQKSKIRLIVQGVTESGESVYQTARYNVQ